MVDLSYQMVLSTLQTAGILVGIAYYLVIMRNSQKTRELTLRNQELTFQSQELSRKAQEQALETRQAQLYMQVYNLFVSKEFVEVDSHLFNKWSQEKFYNYDDFSSKYGPEVNMEEYLIWDRLSHYLEGLGVLVKNDLLKPELLDDLFSGFVIAYWETFEKVILDFRKKHNFPAAWEMTELLYDRVKLIAEKQHGEEISFISSNP
jgi:hypothetical protein